MNKGEYDRWLRHAGFFKSSVLSQVTMIDHLISSLMSGRFSFNEDEQIKFHKIFFEANRISFHAKIESFKQFLKEYEAEWLKQVTDFFEYLDYLKEIRNNFAHSVNPTKEELEQKNPLPRVLLYTYKNSQLVPIVYSADDVDEIIKKLSRIHELLVVVDAKIMNHKLKS